MIRCSRLNAAEHCGLSAAIEDKTTNAYALMGDAFHAAVACHYRPNEQRFRDERDTTMAFLDASQRVEVKEMVAKLAAEWTPPPSAGFETPIGLTRAGLAVPKGDPQAITEGTADCEWDDPDQDEVVVLDFKGGARAEWNVPIPRYNLQLGGYGFAFADQRGRSKMRLGLYLAHEGKWLWDTLDLDSPEATALWERVRGAALHDPTEAVTGPHCGDCWVRLSCPTYLLPIVSNLERTTALAPLGGAEVIEPRKLMRLLHACQAMEAIADRGKAYLKAFVAQHGPIVVDGMQWGQVPVKGKESTSVKALKEAGLYERAVAVGAVKTGATTLQHRWTKERTDAA